MIEIADSIKAFLPATQQADFVPPLEQIFLLTGSQLQEIVKQAVQDALESPEYLCQIVQDQAREIEALNARLEAMQKDMDSLAENQLIQLRLINDLRHKEPGKMEISRAEKIEKYLQARPDHKASFETLRGHLGIDKVLLSQAVKVLMATSPGKYTTIKARGNKRILVLLPSS
jgi:hypothetical protein